MSRVIEIENLAKRYRLGEYLHDTLREALASAVARGPRRRPNSDYVWALRGIDLTVEQGEIVGVIGRNGAGKSTLLSIVARITEPTSGVARTRGHVGTLLEVGTGFHPELTGRENVYLSGALLGMKRHEIQRQFDDIVGFAEIERFLDTPIKRYSSGMQLRLAFAVAAHVEPEIIVVDEVLAVGDLAFQSRCLRRMSELRDRGRTALFVSHDLGAIERLCSRVIWLEHGKVIEDGPTAAVIEAYQRAVTEAAPIASFGSNPGARVVVREVRLTNPTARDANGSDSEHLRRDLPLEIQIAFDVQQRSRQLNVEFQLVDERGVSVVSDGWMDYAQGVSVAEEPGSYLASAVIPPLLPARDYVLHLWIDEEVGPGQYETCAEVDDVRFTLLPAPGDLHDAVVRNRAAVPHVDWSIAERIPVIEDSPAA